MKWPHRATRRIAGVYAALSVCGVPSTAGVFAQAGHADMQTEYVNTVHELSLAAAQALLAKGLAHAADHHLRLAISVVDRSGNLIAFARMDGAPIVTVDVAVGKARTAAFLGAPSKSFEDMINSGKPSMATVPGLLPLQGGMPIVLNGEVIGAVGVSGSSGESDEAVATVIAAAFPQPG